MPNIKSSAKRDQLAKARAAKNKANKSALKTSIKKFNTAVAEGNKDAAVSTYKVAVKAIDPQEQRREQEVQDDAEAQRHGVIRHIRNNTVPSLTAGRFFRIENESSSHRYECALPAYAAKDHFQCFSCDSQASYCPRRASSARPSGFGICPIRKSSSASLLL